MKPPPETQQEQVDKLIASFGDLPRAEELYKPPGWPPVDKMGEPIEDGWPPVSRTPKPETNHDGEDMAQATDRYWDNWEDPFDKHAKSRGRFGWFDLLAGHASTNLAVTKARFEPRAAGHWLANSVRINVALFVLAAAGWAWALVLYFDA